MANGKLVLNKRGMRHLLTEGVRPEIERRTKAIHEAAGGDDAGFFLHVSVLGDRVVGRVVAGYTQAQAAEARDGRLSKAVDAGRN